MWFAVLTAAAGIAVAVIVAACEPLTHANEFGQALPDATTVTPTSCGTGQTLCAVDGGTVCTDTMADPNNCGACGAPCDPTFTCSFGSCACPSGQNNCSGVCSDLTQDDLNCGACDSGCNTDSVCITNAQTSDKSKCLIFCTAGLTNCGTYCANLKTESQHCNGCDNTCPDLYSCVDGGCVSGCSQGDTVCDDTCVDLTTSPAHCGTCGNACPVTGAKCSGSECLCNTPGYVSCFASKVSANLCTLQNAMHCGPQCQNCRPPDGGLVSGGYCTLGFCTFDAGSSATGLP